MPADLYRKLAIKSEEEGVFINKYTLSKISWAVKMYAGAKVRSRGVANLIMS